MRRFVTVCLHRFGGLNSPVANVYAVRHDRIEAEPGRLVSAPFDAADMAAMRLLSASRPSASGYHTTGLWLTLRPGDIDRLCAVLEAVPPPRCRACAGSWALAPPAGQVGRMAQGGPAAAVCAACDGTGRLSRPLLAWRLAADARLAADNADFVVTQAVRSARAACASHPLPPRVAALAATDIDPEVWLDALEDSSAEPWVEAAVAYWRAATAAGFWFLSPFTSYPVAHHLPWNNLWSVWQPS